MNAERLAKSTAGSPRGVPAGVGEVRYLWDSRSGVSGAPGLVPVWVP